MKITIVDIINMLAKEEETPKYIRYFNKVQREWLVMLVCKENIITRLNENAIFLNDEVDIIEEEKEIKKIKSNGYEFYSDINIWTKKEETVAYCECLMNKVNELIDAVNESKGKSE